MKMKLNKKGFTLVELVIVVAVLAILAVVAVPVVSGIVDNSRTASDNSQLALIQSAVERYNAEKGTYPGGDSEAAIKSNVKTVLATYTNLTDIPTPQKASYGFYYKTGKVVYAKDKPEGYITLSVGVTP